MQTSVPVFERIRVKFAYLIICTMIAFGASISFALAQGEQETAVKVELPSPQSEEIRWQDELGTFRVGIMAGSDINGSVYRAELFRQSLANGLDMQVELVPFSSWLTLANAHASGRVDYAIHTALSYAMTQLNCNCLEPLVVPSFSGGAKSIRLVIFTLKGTSISLGPQSNIKFGVLENANHLDVELVQAFLKAEQQFGASMDTDNLSAFATEQQAYEALKSGQVDALLGWSTFQGQAKEGYSHGTWRALLSLENVDPDDLKLVWRSPSLPNGPHVVRRVLSLQAKSAIQELLLKMHEFQASAYDAVARRYAGGFRAAQHQDFSQLTGLLEKQLPATNGALK